jgi:hypothetical protein
MEMEKLGENEITRMLDFITENELDYQYIDNGIFRPYFTTYDNKKIYLGKNEGMYIICTYDPEKDKPGINGAWQWETIQNVMQIIERLKQRDESIYKVYWELTTNSIEIPFDVQNYNNEWHEEFKESEGYTKEQDSLCTYVVFESNDYEPEIMSPWNTVGSDSLGGFIHDSKPNKLSKLRFEIHPIRTIPGNETYLFKIRCNDDENFPENICYKVVSKKGLRLIRQSIFTEMESFRKKQDKQ